MKEPPPKPTYRSVKTSLKSVVKNNLVTEKLIDTVFRASSIMIRALQLLKLYLLHCCDVGDELPKLDRRFVTSVMKALCKAPSTGRPPSVETQITMDTLKDFYDQHYKLQSLREEKERGEQASEPSVQRVHLPEAEAGGLHASPNDGSSSAPEAVRGAVRKRSRHGCRDRELELEAAPQAHGAHQGQGL